MLGVPLLAVLVAQLDTGPLTELERRCQDPEQAGELICDDVQGEELNLDYPLEARPDTEEARTTARLHAALTGGPVVSGAATVDVAAKLSIGKPLFFWTRHRHFQGLLDTHVGLQLMLPARRVGLTLSPQMGINWYFGSRVGFELRAGFGFAAELHPQVSRFGVGIPLGAAIVIRPFSDDRKRIKLVLEIDEHALLISTPVLVTVSLGLGLGFELPVL